MIAVKAKFDGRSIKLLEPPPSTRPASVIVTFLPDEDEASGLALKEETVEYQTPVTQPELADLVDKVRLVLNTDGRPTAVQMDIADWLALMDWLEDVEDIQLMRERFRERSERTVTKWEDFEAELKADGLL